MTSEEIARDLVETAIKVHPIFDQAYWSLPRQAGQATTATIVIRVFQVFLVLLAFLAVGFHTVLPREVDRIVNFFSGW